jgi:putative NIF3 family GTP cyclohydrolase 1 type 2
MVVTIEDVARALEELAPPGLAEPWDRCGLQVGDPRAPVHAVLVALDPSPQALSEALRRRAQLLVTHHPLLLEPPASLDLSTPLPRLLADFIRSDVGVYAAHTSLDRAPGGVNDALARCLGLGEVRCLGSGETLYKLVVTIPLGYEDPVRRALAAAGAGKIGKYEGCGFGCRGMGVFVPREGARPFLGEPGKEERADETRWEVVVRRSALPGHAFIRVECRIVFGSAVFGRRGGGHGCAATGAKSLRHIRVAALGTLHEPNLREPELSGHGSIVNQNRSSAHCLHAWRSG